MAQDEDGSPVLWRGDPPKHPGVSLKGSHAAGAAGGDWGLP